MRRLKDQAVQHLPLLDYNALRQRKCKVCDSLMKATIDWRDKVVFLTVREHRKLNFRMNGLPSRISARVGTVDGKLMLNIILLSDDISMVPYQHEPGVRQPPSVRLQHPCTQFTCQPQSLCHILHAIFKSVNHHVWPQQGACSACARGLKAASCTALSRSPTHLLAL